jgi:lysophospholipase L1-like esterase
MGTRLSFVLRRITALSIAIALLAAAAARGASPATAPSSAPSAADKSASAKWEKEIAAFEEADKTSPPPRGAIVFVGSSTIRLWKSLADDFAGYTVINRGFGGSELADSVYFADRMVIPYHPRMIVLFAGTNDINAGKSPQQVFSDYQSFVAKVRAALPDARIAYLSIAPCPSRWKQAEKQTEANHLIRDFAKAGTNLDYIEVWDQLLGPDGRPRADLYLADGLHPNAEGYKIRAATIRPHLGQRTTGN